MGDEESKKKPGLPTAPKVDKGPVPPPGFVASPTNPLRAEHPYTKNRAYFNEEKKQWIDYDTGKPIPSEGSPEPPPHEYGRQIGGGHTREKGIPAPKPKKEIVDPPPPGPRPDDTGIPAILEWKLDTLMWQLKQII
jgi:hypothetical protein